MKQVLREYSNYMDGVRSPYKVAGQGVARQSESLSRLEPPREEDEDSSITQ